MTTETNYNAVSGPSILAARVGMQDILSVGLATRPDAVALVTSGGSWTFAELDRASDSVARGYLRLGAKPGDRVASLLPNRPELLVHYVACLKVGLVLVPLNYRYTPPEMDHALGVVGASILVAVAEREDDLARLTVQPTLGTVALGWTSDSNGVDSRYLADFESLMQEEGGPVARHPESEEGAPAVVFFTSGSTGKPKGVTHTYDSFRCCVSSEVQAYGLTERDVLMPTSSCSHCAGFFAAMSGFAVGAKVVMTESAAADAVLPLLRTARPTWCFFLPSFLLMLVRDARARREDFGSIRLLTSGGDKVPRRLQEECHEVTGLYISEVYGMSEAGALTYHGENDSLDELMSIGRAVPGIFISIRDATTKKEVPLGEDGRLWIKGPLIMKEYWDNPKATLDAFQDEWMDTGDVAKADKDGYVWFDGRQKQIIVHDSSNISPLEVEDVLMKHPAVDQAGVVGVHDVVHGENVHAFVTLKDGVPKPSEQELIEHARKQIGYKAPERIHFLSHMPLNPTGKVDRAELKREGETPDTLAMRNRLRNVLKKMASAARRGMVEMHEVHTELLQFDFHEDEHHGSDSKGN